MPRSPPSPPDFLTGPPEQSSTASSSALILAIVISSTIIASGAVYLLLRLLRSRRSPRTFSVVDDVIVASSAANRSSAVAATSPSFVSSLPSFTFGSVTGTLTGGDCAVCLGRFERSDLLRLLPLCCHAFHAQCVDAWLASNLTCPLCRSSVHPSEDEVFAKILSQTRDDFAGSNSFRIDIGSISRRRGGPDGGISGDRRSYSVGEFDYIIDEGYQVPVESTTHRRGLSDDSKEIRFPPSAPEIPPEELAAAVGNSRSWLREYVDRLASVSSRSSGRFFTGSSRRSEVAIGAVIGEETEGYRVGEEISELFRWLSGV